MSLLKECSCFQGKNEWCRERRIFEEEKERIQGENEEINTRKK